MRIALTLLIALHGIIHLFGFFKAFGISEFNAISQPVSKTFGVFWGLAFLLFAITIVLMFMHSDYWWLGGFLAVGLSQILVFNYWSDAKFGTIANAIILLAIIIGYANFNLKNKINRERQVLFENSQVKEEVITEKTLQDLAPIVRKWLTGSGVIGKRVISNVFLIQELQLKMNPEQTSWNKGTATQLFTIEPPAFNWHMETHMNVVLSVSGNDIFEAGQGGMTIKLLSLFPVATVQNDEKINQATLQRYLAEMVWFPSAALSPYITWEAIDDHAARAIMDYNGTKGSGEFYFDKDGNFEKFVSLRYRDARDAEPTKWIVSATKIEERNGIKTPIECEASWELEQGAWTWLKLKITDIQYNVKEMPKP